jgi:hypothetical protein
MQFNLKNQLACKVKKKNINININWYYGADLALEMLNEKESLAFARGGDLNETGLHLLARKYSVCDCQTLGHRKNLLHLCK